MNRKRFSTVKKLGGQIKSIYALLGEQDLALIVELPGIAEAVKCSLASARQSGIAFSTSLAIPVEQFDKLAAEV